MDTTETILCLIKFGKKQHLESLLHHGALYFNSPGIFNDLKAKNTEQGDENEGAIWIENVRAVRVTCTHPTLGEFKFDSVPNSLSKLTQFNHNFLSCSFYCITSKDFENTDSFKIDKRMAAFGQHALVINKPKLFIESLLVSADRENLALSGKKVEYMALTTEGRIEMNPFIKKKDHIHQKEYRFILKNQINPRTVVLGGLETYGTIVPSKPLIEGNWEVQH